MVSTVVISTNVQEDFITVTKMPNAVILLDHILVLVKLDMKEMEFNVPLLTLYWFWALMSLLINPWSSVLKVGFEFILFILQSNNISTVTLRIEVTLES